MKKIKIFILSLCLLVYSYEYTTSDDFVDYISVLFDEG